MPHREDVSNESTLKQLHLLRERKNYVPMKQVAKKMVAKPFSVSVLLATS